VDSERITILVPMSVKPTMSQTKRKPQQKLYLPYASARGKGTAVVGKQPTAGQQEKEGLVSQITEVQNYHSKLTIGRRKYGRASCRDILKEKMVGGLKR